MKLKYFLIAIGIIVILYFTIRIIGVFALSGAFEKTYTRNDAINNYNEKEKEIGALVHSFNSFTGNLSPNKGAILGIGEKNKRFDIGIFLLDGSILENDPNIGGAKLQLTSSKMDTLLKILKREKRDVAALGQELENANCMSISNRDIESVSIEFGDSNWGGYSYIIFNKSLSDSLILKYKKNASDTILKENVVLHYTSAL
jgi:hypothetical protein